MMDLGILTELIERLAADPEEHYTLEGVIERVARDVPGCDYSSVFVTRGKRVEIGAASGPVAANADKAQLEFDEGPCLDALWNREIVLVSDTGCEKRWPRWAKEAHEAGVGSSLSIRLATGDDMLGCLNMYSTQSDAFEDDAVDIAAVYARIASVVMLKAREVDGLRSALQSRHIISTAQGILMQQYGISLNRSFEVMRRLSNESNIKLRTLALQIVREHDATAWVGEHIDNTVEGEDRHDESTSTSDAGIHVGSPPAAAEV